MNGLIQNHHCALDSYSPPDFVEVDPTGRYGRVILYITSPFCLYFWFRIFDVFLCFLILMCFVVLCSTMTFLAKVHPRQCMYYIFVIFALFIACADT